MGKNIKKSLIVFLICLFGCNSIITAYGDEDISGVYQEIDLIVEQMYGDVSYIVKDIIPIYDCNFNICEYVFDVGLDNVDYGYFVYNIEANEVIKFKFDTYSGESFEQKYFGCEEITDKIAKKVDEFTYELNDYQEGVQYVASKHDLMDIFFDNFELVYCSYILKKEKYIPNRVQFGEDYINKKCNKNYCCAAVAILNVLGQYKCYNTNSDSSVSNAYTDIYNMGGVKKLNEEYVMDQTKMGQVVADYAKINKNKNIPYQSKKNPDMDFFVDAVDKKYSSILGITSKCGGGVAGHAVSVTGYLEFTPVTHGNDKRFLAVASGWGEIGDTEYILYDEIDVYSKYGVKFQQTIYK